MLAPTPVWSRIVTGSEADEIGPSHQARKNCAGKQNPIPIQIHQKMECAVAIFNRMHRLTRLLQIQAIAGIGQE